MPNIQYRYLQTLPYISPINNDQRDVERKKNLENLKNFKLNSV